jgi:hypothetical protein
MDEDVFQPIGQNVAAQLSYGDFYQIIVFPRTNFHISG